MEPKKSKDQVVRLNKKFARVFALLSIPVMGLAILPQAQATAKPVTITFASWQFAEPGTGAGFLALVKEFNDSQKAIVVETANTPFATYSSALKVQLGAGAGPDVFQLDFPTFVTLQRADKLSNLTGAIKRSTSGFSAIDKKNYVGRKKFGVIWIAVNYALIMNQDLFDRAGLKAPTTYAEFLATAKALTDGKGQFGFGVRNIMADQNGWWLDISNWVYGNGGRWTSAEGTPTIDSPKVIEAVTRFRDFFANNYFPQGADVGTWRRMFWEGKIGMAIEANSVVPILLGGNPKLNITSVPMPFVTKANVTNVTQLSINKNSNNTKRIAAVKFLNFVTSSSTQKKLSTIVSGSILATKVPLSKELLTAKPWLAAFNAVAPFAVVPAPQGAEQFSAQIQFAVLTELDKVLRQSKDPATAMRDAQKVAEGIVK